MAKINKAKTTAAEENKDKFIIVANAFKTKDNKKFVFTIDGHKYMLCKATVNDWRYSSFSGEYIIKEIVSTETTEEAL